MSRQHRDDEVVVLGEITGAHGLNGWVKIFSYTRPREQIFAYDSWQLGRSGELLAAVSKWRVQGKTLVAKLESCADRNQAEALAGKTISIFADELPKLGEGQYYWRQLTGLRVVNQAGIDLGRVTEILETGSNDVMLVSSNNAADADKPLERALPWLDEVIIAVDLDAGLIQVDWEADY